MRNQTGRKKYFFVWKKWKNQDSCQNWYCYPISVLTYPKQAYQNKTFHSISFIGQGLQPWLQKNSHDFSEEKFFLRKKLSWEIFLCSTVGNFPNPYDEKNQTANKQQSEKMWPKEITDTEKKNVLLITQTHRERKKPVLDKQTVLC